MNYHRWISLDGTIMTAVDVAAYKRVRRAEAFMRRLPLWLRSILSRKSYDRQTLTNSAVSFLLATWLPIPFYV